VEVVAEVVAEVVEALVVVLDLELFELFVVWICA